jgi:hypothetical protein
MTKIIENRDLMIESILKSLHLANLLYLNIDTIPIAS